MIYFFGILIMQFRSGSFFFANVITNELFSIAVHLSTYTWYNLIYIKGYSRRNKTTEPKTTLKWNEPHGPG